MSTRSPIWLAKGAGIALAMVAVLAGNDGTGKGKAGSPAIGRPAPPFSLYDTEGALVSLSDLAYQGKERSHRPKKVVVLDFFRTDCKPCRKSLPKLVGLQRSVKGKAVQVMMVSLLEEEEGEEKLRAFLKKSPVPFPVLIDAYGVVAKKYIRKGNALKLPSLFVIDREGVLRAQDGFIDTEGVKRLHEQIKRLLD